MSGIRSDYKISWRNPNDKNILELELVVKFLCNVATPAINEFDDYVEVIHVMCLYRFMFICI